MLTAKIKHLTFNQTTLKCIQLKIKLGSLQQTYIFYEWCLYEADAEKVIKLIDPRQPDSVSYVVKVLNISK